MIKSIFKFIADAVRVLLHVGILIGCLVFTVALFADYTEATNIWSDKVHHQNEVDIFLAIMIVCCAVYSFASIMDCLFGNALKVEKPELQLSKAETLKRRMQEHLNKEEYEKAVEIRNELRKLRVTE